MKGPLQHMRRRDRRAAKRANKRRDVADWFIFLGAIGGFILTVLYLWPN